MNNTMNKTLRDISDWSNKRVLLREDFNVPQTPEGKITDNTRIREALPTIQYLLERNTKLIIVSHLGRPKGKVSPEFSLKPVADSLQNLLPYVSVQFYAETDWNSIQQHAEALQAGQILLLENIRFYPGEEKNDTSLAQQLAALGDVYVNDAFGASHRAHASTEGVAHYLKPAVAGLLMEKEIKALSEVLNSSKPLTAIIGGSKVSTKITVLQNLLPKVQTLIIGGGMIFTFLKAQGISVGQSLVEDEFVEMARQLLAESKRLGVTFWLPSDLIVADRFAADAASKTVDVHQIPADWMGLDIGPSSIAEIKSILENSPLVLWNGPLGVFEFLRFAEGTHETAKTLAKLTQEGRCQSVLGGGDTLAALEQFHLPLSSFTHVSTGGGASLEFLEGKTLPGIAALDAAVMTVK